MNRGISLLELVIGITLAGVVGLMMFRFSDNVSKTQNNMIVTSETEQRLRQFIEAQKKHIGSSRNPFPGANVINSQFTNRNCSYLTLDPPTLANCGDTTKQFSKLIIERYKVASDPSTYFTEIVKTECLKKSTALLQSVTIPDADLASIRECSDCKNDEIPVIRITRSNTPDVITRYYGLTENLNTATSAGDDTTVASSFCVTHNALANPTDPNSFNQFNLRARVLVRLPKTVKMLELSSIISTPQPPAGGFRVLSSGSQ